MLAEDIRHPEKQPNSSKGGRKKYKRQKKRQQWNLTKPKIGKYQQNWLVAEEGREREAESEKQRT